MIEDDKKSDTKKAETKSEGKFEPKSEAKADVKADAKADKTEAKDVKAEAKAVEPKAEKAEAKDLPPIEPPDPIAEPWPDATPQPMKPVDPPIARARTETVGMPSGSELGKPPEMPKTVTAPPAAAGSVEDPTFMPGPREVPSGNADDPAAAPGRVPPGDSRSLRRGNDFALVYRVATCVISRTGPVGKRGVWRVVEYPTSASASHGYAKECSRFVSEGFSDYRD